MLRKNRLELWLGYKVVLIFSAMVYMKGLAFIKLVQLLRAIVYMNVHGNGLQTDLVFEALEGYRLKSKHAQLICQSGEVGAQAGVKSAYELF